MHMLQKLKKLVADATIVVGGIAMIVSSIAMVFWFPRDPSAMEMFWPFYMTGIASLFGGWRSGYMNGDAE